MQQEPSRPIDATQQTNTLEFLPAEALTELQKDFSSRVEKKLDRALPDDTDAEIRKALQEVLLMSIHARSELDDKTLFSLAKENSHGRQKKISSLKKAMKKKAEPFSLRQKFRIAASRYFRAEPESVRKAFGEKKRIYVSLDSEAIYDVTSVSAYADIRWHLISRGYKITDYVAGYATDDAEKQAYRIGKLLKHQPGLLKKFTEDSGRTIKKLVAVFSLETGDIAHMSANRGWHSCMSPTGGFFFNYVAQDILRGTLAAYLVSRNDPEIHDPLARILLKPYRNKDTVVYRAEKPYGLPTDAFIKAAENFSSCLNRGAPAGVYRLDRKLYADGRKGRFIHKPEEISAEEFLKGMGVKFIKKEGMLVVDGNLDLDDMGLKVLPDLSKVVVTGNFYCSNNHLETLAGSPAEVHGSYLCANNRLTSPEGCTRKIGHNFICDKNNLKTLKGGPEEVGRDYHCAFNSLSVLDGAPEKIPERFICANNPLVTLKGGPRETGGIYDCSRARLKDMADAPQIMSGLASDHGYFPSRAALEAFLQKPAEIPAPFHARHACGKHVPAGAAAGLDHRPQADRVRKLRG